MTARRPRLEPCPVCGNKPSFEAILCDDDHNPIPPYVVWCPWMSASAYLPHSPMFVAQAPKLAAKAWNEYTMKGTEMTLDFSEMTELEQAAHNGISAAQTLAHETATNAGWYKDPTTGQPIERKFGEVIALMHSELSEALEADRKSLKDDKLPHRDGREVEFADCIIRILDTAAALGLDVAGAIIEKNRFNKQREDHKLAARASGGKKY